MRGSLRFILKYTGKFVLLFLLILICACSKNEHPKEKSVKPANVSNGIKESDLTTVILSPKAEKRLGIEVITVEYRNIHDTLKTGGEIISPPGYEVRVAAPMAGTVSGIHNDELPPAGTKVKRGQAILSLLLLTPEKDLASARETVEVKQVQLKVAQAQADRTKQLLQDKATSEKLYLQAQAGLAAARASLNAAEARLNLLNGNGQESATEGISTFVLKSPVNGVIQRIHVASRQAVAASTLLFEVASQNPLWLRVPVYVGDLAKIDSHEDAIIYPLGINNDKTVYRARPVEGPLISDANSVSSDLFFEISNHDGLFRTGQKVNVLLTQLGSGENLAIPSSSVMYDIYGGSWAYVKSGQNTYTRHRVEISSMIDGFAVLEHGLKRGDEVVISGVAELFGIEFGGGK